MKYIKWIFEICKPKKARTIWIISTVLGVLIILALFVYSAIGATKYLIFDVGPTEKQNFVVGMILSWVFFPSFVGFWITNVDLYEEYTEFNKSIK